MMGINNHHHLDGYKEQNKKKTSSHFYGFLEQRQTYESFLAKTKNIKQEHENDEMQ